MEFNVKFRAFRREDAQFVNNLRKDDQMESLIGGPRRYVSYERDLKWIEDIIYGDSQSTLYFAVTTLDDDKIIGYTSISDIDYRNGSCFWSGIKLDPSVGGRGYGLQVALLAVKYAFEQMRMVRCIGMCQESHAVAYKLMEKTGFVNEGLMRKYLFKNGQHINTFLMSMTDDDYVVVKQKFDL